MPITWDEKSDAKLLAGVLSQTSTGLDFNALAKYMGDGCTVSALRHRIVRIKKKVADDENLMNASQSSPGTPNTSAVKRKRGCAPKATPTKLKQEASSDDDEKEDVTTKGEEIEAEGKRVKVEHVESDELLEPKFDSPEDDDKLFQM
ncbi:uncharacterized protein N7446_003772 [Penicillium canescens]|uniref:Uncharacterized protein n=1 Tax=Penicillium canescens TaxID=5083 RepID=A0AAD6I2I8_PENCN|nr:uncharacterized protein N7446_003772 [Penicillium canescens]KAJ6027632.1 hypothetical protein N7460_012449 [Penicillium canescens]KAJ6040910.1 hypothetical protein N7444_009815 [Penicillium canescens]KAJ6066735.1 hypothetical protein N7446_003772 [Penicillium canescens]